MPWGGFVPPVPTTTPSPTNPAPATPSQAFSSKKVEPPRPAVNKKLDYYIDKDVVEAVLADRNAIEIKWLDEVLSQVKIRNPKTGRYLKVDRYVEQIRRIQSVGDYQEVSSYSIEE